ncbi:hypothetical protein ABK950_23745, partial [Citrobacter freundii]
FIVGGPVGDFELLLCHGTVCVVGKIRDLILQLSKSSIYSTKPVFVHNDNGCWFHCCMPQTVCVSCEFDKTSGVIILSNSQELFCGKTE